MKNLAVPFAVLFFGILFISCEKGKNGTVDPLLVPPLIVSSSLHDTSVNLDTTSSGAVTRLPDGTFRISDSLHARLIDPNGSADIASVTYRVHGPLSPDYFATGEMVPKGVDSIYTGFAGRVSFTLSRNEAGTYRIEVIALGRSNLTSNSQQVSLLVTRRNSLPRLGALFAPDTVVRPTTGYALVFLAVTATDSDGLDDIVNVYFRSLYSTDPNFEHPMLDDGNLNVPDSVIVSGAVVSRDSVAGDGRFSRVIPVFSNLPLGTKLFRFYVVDKSGVVGDSLDHTIAFISR